MRPDDNLVLTGFMATGKTTVGRSLAERLGLEFVDTDLLIESMHGPISQIFEQKGEEWFRSIERGVAAELGTKTGLVIATGGRMLLDPENLRSLSRHGRIFCLVAAPDEIRRRAAGDATRRPRPLLQTDDPEQRIDELMNERERQYRRFPQIATDDAEPETVVDEIVELWDGPISFDVEGPVGGYRFSVGAGILPFVRRLASIDGPMVVVTEEVVGSLFAPSLGDVDLTVALPSERVQTTLDAARAVHDQLADAQIDASATIVALGTGVIAETAGVVASMHPGGLDVVHCPTDLIGMLAKGLGGSVSWHTRDALDPIENVRQPKAIIAETATVQTLSWHELSSGLAEVIELGHASPDLLDTIQGAISSPGRSDQPVRLTHLQAVVTQALGGHGRSSRSRPDR